MVWILFYHLCCNNFTGAIFAGKSCGLHEKTAVRNGAFGKKIDLSCVPYRSHYFVLIFLCLPFFLTTSLPLYHLTSLPPYRLTSLLTVLPPSLPPYLPPYQLTSLLSSLLPSLPPSFLHSFLLSNRHRLTREPNWQQSDVKQELELIPTTTVQENMVRITS